jgi:putative ABC transport system permease protein
MPQRLGRALLSALGGLTIVLVIVGAAGTVAYGVSRRRREIGVRLALGARRAQVAGAMTRGALVSMAGGVLAGIIGAAALGRLASAFLYGIEPTDVASFAATATVLVLATGAASFLPAWRLPASTPPKFSKRNRLGDALSLQSESGRSLIADTDRRRGSDGAPDGS